MLVDSIFTPGLAQVAYLIADEAAQTAAVIDPRRDIDPYLAWASARHLTIRAILETHVHADFGSGARELAAATGAPIAAGHFGDQVFVDRPLADGDEVRVGRLRLRALWTPGHTPEHVAYLLIDPELSAEPVAIFSGDALFVGEVGRPDLLGPTATQRLAAQLYETVAGRLSKLANDLIVYPGHTAGSPCGKKIGAASRTTIGQEKLTNYAFQARSKQQFIEMVLAGMPQPPTYYPTLKRINQAGPPLMGDLPNGHPLTPQEIAAALDRGALLIDTRTPDAFGSGHIRDAISVGLDDRFLPWMGWLAPYDRDLVLLLADDEQFEMARTSLRRIGLDRVHGYLAGGIAAWRADGRDLVTLPQVNTRDLARDLASDDRPLVLDVRDDAEWESGHIAGAVHRFAGEIARGAAAPLNGAREIVVICGSGYRSSFAASLLQGRGVTGLRNVAGGMTAWLDAKLPIVTA